KRFGLELGLSEKKLIPLGIPQLIVYYKPKIQKKAYEKSKFLVILDHEENHKYNVAMLDICNQFAKQVNMCFDVKLHPSSDILQKGGYGHIVNKEWGSILNMKASPKTKQELFSGYEFGVFSQSTMIFEAIYCLLPVVLYRHEKIIYPEIELPYFSTCKELEDFKDSRKEEVEYWRQLRDYVCGDGDIAENYAKFLNQFC
ncbi:MAG: hypothetical protein K2H34_10275, partial [Lachnospiraceae bacterium]|nr:hypothetical protein [Lachnospiraceae bacterium]